MKAIAYKTETGIAIIYPTESFYREYFPILKSMKGNKGKTDQEIDDLFYVMTAKKDAPEGCEYKIVERSEISSDRTFRNAWNYDLKPDIPKSKEIWKDKLRLERAPIFSELDSQYFKEWEGARDENVLLEIAKQKQDLRDLPIIVDVCKTIDEIKAVAV